MSPMPSLIVCAQGGGPGGGGGPLAHRPEGTLKINHREVPIEMLCKQDAATQIRAKYGYEMNDAEKLFIAMDRILEPDLYANLPEDERISQDEQSARIKAVLAELDRAALLELVGDEDVVSMTEAELDAHLVLRAVAVPEEHAFLGRRTEVALAPLRADVRALLLQPEPEGGPLAGRNASRPGSSGRASSAAGSLGLGAALLGPSSSPPGPASALRSRAASGAASSALSALSSRPGSAGGGGPLLPGLDPVLPAPPGAGGRGVGVAARPDRSWGSWEAVHPAACGVGSQEALFDPWVHDARRDHPAAYAAWADFDPFDKEAGRGEGGAGGAIVALAPAAARWLKDRGRARLVVAGLKEVCLLEPGLARQRGVVVASGVVRTLFEDPEIRLGEGRSRALDFTVEEPPDGLVLDFSVAVVFRGHFDDEGNYHLARLAGSLFRLPPEEGEGGEDLPPGAREVLGGAGPVPVGFAAHGLQSLNTPTSLGRLVLQHRPRAIPVRPGTFRLIVGAASDCRYSVRVTARLAEDAAAVVDRELSGARDKHQRAHACAAERRNAELSLRLAKRKARVARGLLDEAKAELRRTRADIDRYKRHLKRDDEEMFLSEEARDEIAAEVAALEEEFSQWASVHRTRHAEVGDVKEGIKELQARFNDLSAEKISLKEQLEELRKTLPTAISVLRGPKEAAAAAFELNASLDPFANGRWVSADEQRAKLADVLTPADEARFKYRYQGWEAMTPPERQFLALDRALRPELYAWALGEDEGGAAVHVPLRLQGHQQRRRGQPLGGPTEERPARGGKGAGPGGGGKPAPVAAGRRGAMEAAAGTKRPPAAAGGSEGLRASTGTGLQAAGGVPGFEFTREEILRIQSTDFAALTRRELEVRKVLARFHEDAQRARLERDGGQASELAPRVRQKDPRHWTVEEIEWVSIDKVLYPGTWAYLERGRRARPHAELAKDARRRSFLGRFGRGELRAEDEPDEGQEEEEALDLEAWKQRRTRYWECPFDRPRLLEIWRTPPGRAARRLDPEERKAHRLLMKYRGEFNERLAPDAAAAAARAAAQAVGATAFRLGEDPATRAAREGDAGPDVILDIDHRCRTLLKEHDRIAASAHPFADSFVLHVTPQRFPSKVLCLQLLQEVDRLLQEQVFERERALQHGARLGKEKKKGGGDGEGYESWDDDLLAPEEGGGEEEEGRAAAAAAGREGKGKGPGGAAAAAAGGSRRAHGNGRGTSGGGGGGGGGGGVVVVPTGRKSEEQKRIEKQVTLEGEDENRRRLQELLAGLSARQKEKEEELAKQSLCAACGGGGDAPAPCTWASCVDEAAIRARRADLGAEIQRIRRTKLSIDIFESDVPLSVLRGGRPTFRRAALLAELSWEDRELGRQLELAALDRELHALQRSPEQVVQIKEIHKYPQLMWKNEAINALYTQREKFIAWTTAVEVVDDLLEGLLEGWVFGVRDSQYPVAGYVPSLKKDGVIRAGAGQRRAMALVDKRVARGEHDARDDREELRRTQKEKQAPIEAESQARLARAAAEQEEKERKHLLDEVEHSMKYGMFLHALNYFRSMTLVRREKNSWRGKYATGMGPELDPYREAALLSRERKKMAEEERNRTTRQLALRRAMTLARLGEERARARLERERRLLRREKYLAHLRRRAEHAAAVALQKAFRGHVGRRRARYWALKRAELEATKVLIQDSAIHLQRCWRGYMARKAAAEAKIELAEFVAMIRAEELAADEVEFWQQSKVDKVQRDGKNFFANALESGIKKPKL